MISIITDFDIPNLKYPCICGIVITYFCSIPAYKPITFGNEYCAT